MQIIVTNADLPPELIAPALAAANHLSGQCDQRVGAALLSDGTGLSDSHLDCPDHILGAKIRKMIERFRAVGAATTGNLNRAEVTRINAVDRGPSMTLQPTPDTTQLGSSTVRVWRGFTDRGVPVVAFIGAVSLDPDADPQDKAPFQAALEEVEETPLTDPAPYFTLHKQPEPSLGTA